MKLFLVILGILALAAVPFRAQQDPPLTIHPVTSGPLTFQEGEALLRHRHYVDLRERAEATVHDNPNSIEGNYFLGIALRYGEGNLPLARRVFENTERLVDAEWRAGELDKTKKTIYAATFWYLFIICQDTEQYSEALRLIDEAKTKAGADFSAYRGWTLMKLGRWEEARAAMREETKSKVPEDRLNALNTLGSIEFSAWNYEASKSWFDQLIAAPPPDPRRPDPSRATYLGNRAQAQWSLLNFSGAEQDLKEAADHFAFGSYSNPWMDLTHIYVRSGRLQFAVHSIERMRSWDAHSDPTLEQDRWSREQLMVGQVQLAAGRDEDARTTSELLLRRPDRLGNNSSDPKKSAIDTMDLYVESVRRSRERIYESMSAIGWSEPRAWFRGLGQSLWLTGKLWLAESQLRSAIFMYPDGLDWTIRPYGPDSYVQEYLRPGFCEILGDGVVEAEATRLLKRTGAQPERERPYLQASLGECLVRRGHFAAAVEPLSQSLEHLPLQEKLLRGRIEALLGEAIETSGPAGSGQTAEAFAHYAAAMQLDPHAFRSLGLALPATIKAVSDDEAARLAVSRLASSPRFRRGQGFMVTIRRRGSMLEASLEDSSGQVLARADTSESGSKRGSGDGSDASDASDAEQLARALCVVANDHFFNSQVNVEQSDIDAITGSPMSAQQLDFKGLLAGGSSK